MRYYVVTQSGSFGPADIGQIEQWSREGRVAPSTILEEEGSGRRILASSLPGLTFTTFQHAPQSGPLATPFSEPNLPQPLPPQPIPPQMVSNYLRPGAEPPLFLPDASDGKRELTYSFLFALLSPVIALFMIYGVAMAIGGMYCASLAIRRGQKLGILSIFLNLAAFALALFLHFGLGWVL
ncbi:MAG TPA: hypothetical protein VHE55_05095 [Fimbriimonadaceae bacterium]|nr:hypothetical protein [Fimbriimonadaceae bacterium]